MNIFGPKIVLKSEKFPKKIFPFTYLNTFQKQPVFNSLQTCFKKILKLVLHVFFFKF